MSRHRQCARVGAAEEFESASSTDQLRFGVFTSKHNSSGSDGLDMFSMRAELYSAVSSCKVRTGTNQRRLRAMLTFRI